MCAWKRANIPSSRTGKRSAAQSMQAPIPQRFPSRLPAPTTMPPNRFRRNSRSKRGYLPPKTCFGKRAALPTTEPIRSGQSGRTSSISKAIRSGSKSASKATSPSAKQAPWRIPYSSSTQVHTSSPCRKRTAATMFSIQTSALRWSWAEARSPWKSVH